MKHVILQQATVARHGPAEVRWLARSVDFLDAWQPRVEELCRLFGERPDGVRCPEAVFAQSFGKRLVAVVRVADLGADDPAVPPAALGFHFLVLHEADYRAAGGDPFALAAACPPDWHRRGSLPAQCFDVPPPRRTVAQVCDVLQREDGPTLLGATQGLMDGCRVAWGRPAPDTALLRALWTLLPTSARCDLWPASFAFGNALGFHAVVFPVVPKDQVDARYLSEQQADNYPEGRYELTLQTTAEAGDEEGLDLLFARRSPREVWRLGWLLAGLFVILSLATPLVKGCAR
jgi:hypothetical protein